MHRTTVGAWLRIADFVTRVVTHPVRYSLTSSFSLEPVAVFTECDLGSSGFTGFPNNLEA